MRPIIGNSHRRADLTVHPNGRIDVSSYVACQLDMHTGDIVDVCTDGEEYHLFIQGKKPDFGRYEGAVYATRKIHNNHCYRLNSVRIARALLEAAHGEGVIRLATGEPVTGDFGRKEIPIITARKI